MELLTFQADSVGPRTDHISRYGLQSRKVIESLIPPTLDYCPGIIAILSYLISRMYSNCSITSYFPTFYS